MKASESRKLSQIRYFTREEMELTLKNAFNDKSINWEKASPSNKAFSLGSYFNDCVRWVRGSSRGMTDLNVSEIVAFRVLNGFGKYHKDYPFGMGKDKPKEILVKYYEQPSLNPESFEDRQTKVINHSK